MALGCLALGMMHQLSGGAWGVVIRRPIGAAARTLPVMAVLFLPIVLGMHHLYDWTHADVVAHDEVLQAQAALPERRRSSWCAPRSTSSVWNALAYFLNAWSLRAGPRPAIRASRAACSC